MLESILTAENLVALTTLIILEVVLGIDNIIFLSILSSKLPEGKRARARQLGIALAVGLRLLLLLAIKWVTGLTEPLFMLVGHAFSGRDLILLGGGLFLIGKSTYEIHEKLEAVERTHEVVGPVSFWAILIQIAIVDMVFSLDSVITAVGISGKLSVMIPAILVAALVMLVSASAVSSFVERHPTMKILALAFLILIGCLLMVEGWDEEAGHRYHLKNYAYFAMAFSLVVELINMRLRKSSPLRLHNQPRIESEAKQDQRNSVS